jgi:hypothetical protein
VASFGSGSGSGSGSSRHSKSKIKCMFPLFGDIFFAFDLSYDDGMKLGTKLYSKPAENAGGQSAFIARIWPA